MEFKFTIANVQPKKLKLNDYDMGQTLGTGKDIFTLGSFGRVKISQSKTTKKHYAIKILKKAEIIKLKQVDHIMNEVRILSVIDHPFLIKTEGFAQDERYLYLVLELINGGELFTYLRSVGKFQVDQTKYILLTIDSMLLKYVVCLNIYMPRMLYTEI
jgi:serine/threonine protein kinase